MPEVSIPTSTNSTTNTTATTPSPTTSQQSQCAGGTAITPTTNANTPTNTSSSGESGSNDHVCFGCGLSIKDQFFFATLPDIKWHESCLKCAKCECRLTENSTCFVRNGKAYCKDDYAMLFPITKCSRCQLAIKRTDLVFKMAGNTKIYHYECFACQVCSRRFQPGDEYQVLDDYVYCKDDAQMIMSNSTSNQTTPSFATNTPNGPFVNGSGLGHVPPTGQTILSAPPPPHHQQLYLNQLNMLAVANHSSTISLTPENSIQSSSSSSSASFSPNTNSSSSSSSLVDSPSNSSNSLYSSTVGCIAGNGLPPVYNNNNNNNNSSFGAYSTTSSINSSSTYGMSLGASQNFQHNNPVVGGGSAPAVYSNLTTSFMVDSGHNTTTTTTPMSNRTAEQSIIMKDGDDHQHDRLGCGGVGDAMDSDDDQVDDSDSDSDEDNDSGAVGSEEETGSSLNESVNSNAGGVRTTHNSKSNKKSNHNNNNNTQSTPNYASLKPIVNSNNNKMPNQRPNMPFGSGHHLLQQVKSGGHHHHHHHHHSKPARIRTVLNEKQLHTLRACYGANPRPDALMKEQLVEMTGLNPRVIRVWFQNKRCKDKKKNMLGPVPGGNLQQHQHQQQQQQPQQQLPPPSLMQPNAMTPPNLKIDSPAAHLLQQHQQQQSAAQTPIQSTTTSTVNNNNNNNQMRLNINTPTLPPPMPVYSHMAYQQQPYMMFDSSGSGCY